MHVALLLSIFAYLFSSALGTPPAACDWTACMNIYCPLTGPNAVADQGQCLCNGGAYANAESNITTCLVESCPNLTDSDDQGALLDNCCGKPPHNDYADVKAAGTLLHQRDKSTVPARKSSLSCP
jgi:hypothetical protein